MAYGACVQAAVLAAKPDVPSMYVRNVTPLTIGIISSNKDLPCHPVIKKNSSYPIEKVIQGKTKRDNQTNAKIIIFEGEQKTMDANQILGSMTLRGLTASSKGGEIIDISLKLNDKGMISARAIDRRTKLEENINIDKPQRFTENEISEMIKTQTLLRMVAVEDYPGIVASLPYEESSTQNKRLKLEKGKDIDNEVCPVYHQRVGEPEANASLILELED